MTHTLRSAPERDLRSAETDSSYIRPPLVMHTASGTYSLGAARAKSIAETATPSPTPSPTSTALASTAYAAEATAPFFTYTVQPGNTLSAIAKSFGISTEYLVWNNPGLGGDADSLLVGQQLVIPSTNGIIYTLKLGDTLADVAGYYGISTDAIIGYLPNGVSSPELVAEGVTLVLPGAVPPPPPPPPAPTPVYVAEPQPPASVAAPPSAGAPAAPVDSGYGFMWPFSGAISSYWGDGRGHTGIDIDGFGQEGAAVTAAAGGQVVLVAYQGYGYGYHVIIDHGNGFQTLYAHLSDIYVSQGQYVGQGEAIGAVGCTGYCTGTHLHFEIRIGGTPVDPIGYLP